MKFNLFKISKSDKDSFCKEIIESSTPDLDFYFLVILSTLIVALGLVANNLILVIGGMLVAPLLSPILALALGVVIINIKVIMRSIKILLMAILTSSVISYLVGIFIEFDINHIDLISVMVPSYYTFIVAVTAGFAASFAWARPDSANAISGIAISVTLVPPITALGLALASSDMAIFNNAILVLLLNVFGIVLASTIIFLLMGFYKSKKKILAEVKQEEKVNNSGEGIIEKIINK
ncbi:DUF389 domain-containing protein [Candidatus Parcubacteria bacterium]|nr:DUF389 domain-containing protein [Candidatus Parcubacteria bacterium]